MIGQINEESQNNDPIVENVNDNVLAKTFFWMFLGLLLTAIVAWFAYATGLYSNIVGTNTFQFLLVAEIAVVVIFSLVFRKLPAFIVGIMYFIYAAINGLTMSIIFAMFELSSIALLFLISAALFCGLSLYGYRTSKDLGSWRPLLYGTLIVGMIASVINLFIGNGIVDIVIDWIMLFCFFGITAYDMNKIKELSLSPYIDYNKVHIYCAMQLYLDFVNILLRLLSLFGRRRK